MTRLPKFDGFNYVLFLTGVSHQRIPIFTADERFPKIFFENLDFNCRKHDFSLYGFCLLPDHFHLLGHLPEKRKISDFLRDFKGFTAKQILDVLKAGNSPLLSRLRVKSQTGRRKDSRYRIFQEDTFIYNIFSESKLQEKLNYVHYNPVEAGLVKEEGDWPYSSWQKYHCNNPSVMKIDMPLEFLPK